MAGTTRDTISEEAQIRGIAVVFIDTAGLQESGDAIEREGIRRSRESLGQADLVLHVLDASEPLTTDDETYLAEFADKPRILVLNKIDLLDEAERDVLRNQFMRSNLPTVPISATTGEGCELLIYAIDEGLVSGLQLIDVSLNHGDGATLAWLYDHGEIIERRNDNDAVRLKVRLDTANAARFQARDV